MGDEGYVPTLGEYAELVEWLLTHEGLNTPLPEHLVKVKGDAVGRAALRRVARVMEEAYGDG